MKPRLARAGLSNVHPVLISGENDIKVKRLAGKIDRVLVDAPCSGLGTLRRNPDLKWRQTPASVEELTRKQADILAKKLEKEDVEFKEKYLDPSPEKRIERREKLLFDMLEWLAGDLKRQQREALKVAIAKLPVTSNAWLEARRHWRDVLLGMIRKHAKATDMHAFLHRWIIDRAWLDAPDLKQFNAELESASDQLGVAVVAILNDRQRVKVRNTLTDFAQSFEELTLE
jgi:vacuolar-type H+-ATPase subunit I/STV1